MRNGLFSTWRFRSERPVLEVGRSIEVYLTSFDPASGKGEARIGDTVLNVDGASADQLDQLVSLKVDSFDEQTSTGAASIVG